MIDQNGQQPIQIRIANGKTRHYKPTGIKIDPDLFTDGRVNKKHQKAKELNQLIETRIIQYQAQALEGFKKKKPKVDFYEYVEMTIPTLKRKPGTLRQYGSKMRKLKEFAPTFYLSDVDHSFLNRCRAWLENERDNEANTVWSTFTFLRAFIRMAWMNKLIEDYPFHNYEFPEYVDPDKVYLTEDEIKAFDKITRAKDLSFNLMQSGVWFLIACDTGMRISDIEKFDAKKNIVGGRLVFRTEKTKELVGLPVDDYLRKLFERVEYKRLTIHQKLPHQGV